jgi:hypothetical protein
MKEMVRRIKELIEASEPDMTVVKVNGDEPFVPLLTEYVSHDLSGQSPLYVGVLPGKRPHDGLHGRERACRQVSPRP